MRVQQSQKQTATRGNAAKDRYAELKGILDERRRQILLEIQNKMRDVREQGESGQTREVLDAGESAEHDMRDEVEFALIQMKHETLASIEEALNRLARNTYGNCFECGDEIAERRLRALPFAVRCKGCKETREIALTREHKMPRRQVLFDDLN